MIFSPAIFRDRNFVTASLLLGVFGLGLFGNLMLQPMMLESLLAYPSLTIGLVLAPRGLASMFSMMIVGKLIQRTDPRILIAVGIAVFTFGSYYTTQYSLNVDMFWVVVPAIIQGIGLGLVFVPLSTVAFSTLEPRYASEAAGIYSVLRTIGSAIGISIVAKIMTDHAQVAWNQLGGFITATSPALQDYLAQGQLSLDASQTPVLLARELGRQSHMIGILDAYTLVTWSFAAMLPLVLLLKYRRPQRKAELVASPKT